MYEVESTLRELGCARVNATLINLLSCIACQNASKGRADIQTMADNGCVVAGTAYGLAEKLKIRGVITRTPSENDGTAGRPPLIMELSSAIPSEVVAELLAQRPCEIKQ